MFPAQSKDLPEAAPAGASASMWARTSGERATSPARRFSSRWDGVRVLGIGTMSSRWWRIQARASWAGVIWSSSAISRSGAKRSVLAARFSRVKRGWLARKSLSVSWTRAGEEARAERRPGHEADPQLGAARAAARARGRGSRASTRTGPRRAGAPGGRRGPARRVTLQSPRWRALPSPTSSAIAPMVSSIGTPGSGKCRYQRSTWSVPRRRRLASSAGAPAPAARRRESPADGGDRGHGRRRRRCPTWSRAGPRRGGRRARWPTSVSLPPSRVGVGGVDEGRAGVDGVLERGDGLRVVAVAVHAGDEGHGAVADRRSRERSEGAHAVCIVPVAAARAPHGLPLPWYRFHRWPRSASCATCSPWPSAGACRGRRLELHLEPVRAVARRCASSSWSWASSCFERCGRGVAPTAAGEALLTRGSRRPSRAFDAALDAARGAARDRLRPSGSRRRAPGGSPRSRARGSSPASRTSAWSRGASTGAARSRALRDGECDVAFVWLPADLTGPALGARRERTALRRPRACEHRAREARRR